MTEGAALELSDVRKLYSSRTMRARRTVVAVDGVSLTVMPGRNLGLVGESGCGKSTIAKVAVGLEKPTSGAVYLLGNKLSSASGSALRRYRADISMVFQDPSSSINPRWTVLEIVSEPLRIREGGGVGHHQPRVRELLSEVGLDEAYLSRRPHELSGGQRQRVGIARALASEPKVLVLDEAVSALDVSVQAQVLNLLNQIKQSRGLSYLFISHDLSVVRHVADELAVMYLGRVVEQGDSETIFNGPSHPYTAALLNAVPPDSPTAARRERIHVEGELPDPANPPPGCPFASRCWRAQEICRTDRPSLRTLGNGAQAACHFPLNETAENERA